MVSALTMFALITLFEVGRRSYTLRDIFDRKRETRPSRTPPKLLSRASAGPLGWVKYIGKYLFLDGSVQKEYSDYARQIQNRESNSDQMRKRRKQMKSRLSAAAAPAPSSPAHAVRSDNDEVESKSSAASVTPGKLMI